MPWVPMKECEQCGSSDIRLVPDDDTSVGYHSNVWLCANEHNCEVWENDDIPALAKKGEGCN